MARIEKFVTKIKKSNLAILAGITLFLLASFSTIYQGSSLVKETYFSTIGYRSHLLGDISRLTAGENFDYFKSILGPPVFTNKVTSDFTENIFVYDDCFIQAVVRDSSNSVVMYAVTIRNEHFKPVLKLGDKRSITLGKSTFADLEEIFPTDFSNDKFGNTIYFFLGAHDWYYTEKYWGGNPMGYQSFIFADNGSGYQNWVSGEEPMQSPTSTSTDDITLKNYRSTATVNTFAVTAPFVSLEDIGFNGGAEGLLIGPNRNQVRILGGFK